MLFKRLFTGQGQSPRFRISLGLSGMLVSLLLLAAIAGLIPDRHAAIRDGHAQLAESIAVNSSIFITVSDIRRLHANLKIIVERNKDILSAAVRHIDGKALVTIGDHSNWQTMQQGTSSDTQVVVPIFEGSTEWGHVELEFEPLLPTNWYGELLHPVFILLTFMSITSFILFYFYLGKMLKQLDPSQAIPDRVRSALDTMAEGLLVIDAKQNVVMANQAFATLVDEPADALIGRQISRFSWLQNEKESLDNPNSPWTKTLADGHVRTADMIRLEVAPDCSKTFMTNCSPILSGGGKPAGVLISFDDVTELEQKEIELRLSKEEAEQANRFKSEFLANMSHEIRTPMNAILGFAEVLKRGYNRDSSDSIRYLNTIASSGNHLLNLINDILDLSKVEAGHIEIEKTQTSAHQIIQEVLQILQVKAYEKNIYLKYEPAGSLPEFIQTDAGKLRQIMTNLVGNAIKFTESGGVKVVTTFDPGDKQLEINVIDTGIGMTSQQADDIFNPFTQADSSITRRFGGTGLGLTISKRFAEALGGDIVVKSEMGSGSQFITYIKTGSLEGIRLLSIDEILSSYLHQTAAKKQQWIFPSSTILVVDDGEENRELLKVILDDLGIQVDTAENGQIALDKLASQDFDVVLMDVQMPVMDGYTAARNIRESGLTLPVIAMTADAMLGAQQKCLDAGYSEYMTKPVEIDRLIERLAGLLDGKPVTDDQLKTSAQSNSESTIDNIQKVDAEPVNIKGQSNADKIYSSLPISNPKFRGIVEKFVVRLGDQIQMMDSAYKIRDYDELKRLGHWMKGSSGSVGFSQFVKPARQFEQYAMNKDDGNIQLSLNELQALYNRVGIDPEQQDPDFEPTQAVKQYVIPDQLTNRLLSSTPKVKPVVDKFMRLLPHKIQEVDEALLIKDFKTIEKFAYWMKAAGGSVGFDAFTEPARDLESHAKDNQAELAIETIMVIKKLISRIQLKETG